MSKVDWKTIVKGISPILGTALGGPAGGAALAAISNAVLGKRDGTEAEVAAAVAGGNPDTYLQLRRAEHDFLVKMKEQDVKLEEIYSGDVAQVNQTMREESKSEHWIQYSWRPYWGFISATAFGVVCVFVCVLAYQAIFKGKPEAINMIPALVGAFAILFGIPGAILGVASWHRGMMKREKNGP